MLVGVKTVRTSPLRWYASKREVKSSLRRRTSSWLPDISSTSGLPSMPKAAERRRCPAMAGLSSPRLISIFAFMRTIGSEARDSTKAPAAIPATRRACRPTKFMVWRVTNGRKRKVMVSGAPGLEKRHHNRISAGTVSRVWIIIMNIPTVRMKPNSANTLKLDSASAAVAVLTVRMQNRMLGPVSWNVRVRAPSRDPVLAHSCGTRLKK